VDWEGLNHLVRKLTVAGVVRADTVDTAYMKNSTLDNDRVAKDQQDSGGAHLRFKRRPNLGLVLNWRGQTVVLMGFICLMFLVQSLTPRCVGADVPLSIVQSSVDRFGLALNWSDLGTNSAYTVEVQDSLFGGAWLPAPASVWPISSESWKDPRLARNKAEFYRVTVSPAVAQRGKLLSADSLGLLSAADIQAAFTQVGIPLPAGSAVRLYKILYETVNPFNLRTIASGLLVLPQNPSKALPLVSYQHGTIIVRNEVPSAMQGLERVVGLALATSGYAACLPDYVGLGDSPGLHPFVHAKSEATAAVDLLRATRVFCSSNAVALNGQLFLIGYSEGGHATMALHREIETFHTNEFTITASAPMAGPYDLSGVTVTDFLSGRSMPNPYYFLYLLGAYQSIYHIAGSLAEVLASPYDATLPPLLDGQHDGSVINQAMGTSVPVNVLKPEFLQAFRDNPDHPLRLVLKENDLYDWTPKAPMHLYHCDGDQDVLYQNSQVATNSFIQRGATQVQLLNPFPGADHTQCAPIALLAGKIWFDSLVQ
jgi:Secretory lipase